MKVFYRIQQMLMFHQSNLFPVIILPIPNQVVPHFKSATILRKTLHEKPCFSKQASEKSLQGSRKFLQRVDLPFEAGFKRKYHSVCSQMLKINPERRRQQEMRPPNTKFYNRMTASILKINLNDHKTKLKSKYNTRQSLKARQSLKLDAWTGNTPNADFKLHSLYQKEARMQKQSTVSLNKPRMSCKKKAISNYKLKKGGYDSLDLAGWNNLEEIKQDDLYQPA